MHRRVRGLVLFVACVGAGCRVDGGRSTEAAKGDRAETRAPAASAVGVASPVPTPTCPGAPLITSDSLGPIAIGATRAAVVARCGKVRSDTVHLEGEPYPAMAVALGTAVLQILVDGDSAGAQVYRIETSDSTARTVTGIGPGSTVSALEATHGALTFGDAECALFVRAADLPGVSWAVEYPESMDCGQLGTVGKRGGATLPPSARLIRVIVRERQ